MHFYIEHTQISSQPILYGPVNGNQATQYLVTSHFNLSAKAKLFACQGGMMVVIPSVTPGKVNIVLKPSSGLQIPFSVVQYYVYREVELSSFIAANALKPKSDATNSDFMNRLWADHDKRKVLDNTIPDPTPAAVGYSTTFPGNVLIDQLFGNITATVSPIEVKEGEWIGDCVSNCGFEIITCTDHLTMDIDYFKRTSVIFNLQGMPTGTAQEKFLVLLEKEKVLNYIDPAAFWGLHHTVGLDVYDSASVAKKKKIKGDGIFDTIVNKYGTKNSVYIDVRNERGYSYNFFRNYGTVADRDKIIKVNSGVEEAYHIHGWPIYSRDTILSSAAKNKATLNLRIDDNQSPLLFIEDKTVAGKNYISDLIVSSVNMWSKPVVLKFPNKTVGGVRVNISYYLQLHYLRQQDNSMSSNTVVKTNITSYVDSIFTIKDLSAVNPNATVLLDRAGKMSFVNGYDFSYMASLSTWHNNDTVLFFSEATPFLKSSSKEFFPAQDSGKPKVPFISHGAFPVNIVVNKVKIEVSSNVMEMLEVPSYNAESKKPSLKESIHALGISKTELAILMAAGGTVPFNKKYVVFERVTPFGLTDDNAIPYRKYKLKVQVVNDEGIIVIANPASDIFVYGTSSFLLTSHEFTRRFTQPETIPDPSTLRIWDNTGIWNTSFGTHSLVPVVGEDNIAVINQPLQARVYFPADKKGIVSTALNVADVSAALANYPLIVIVHGNGHFFKEYDVLLKQFALNGFIASSINCLTGLGSRTRVLTLFRHLKHLRDNFGAKVQNNVGLFGHSRGGEAVVRAALEIGSRADLADINNIAAVAALAPTDQYSRPSLIVEIPLHILYGSMDGDVTGGVIHVYDAGTENFVNAVTQASLGLASNPVLIGSGFNIYDRARNQEKSMAFVYGGTHNGFITKNKDFAAGFGLRNLLDLENQKILCVGYMTAFFRMIQLSEPVWRKILNGDRRLSSATTEKVFLQYEDPSALVVEDFEAAPNDTDASDGILVGNILSLDLHTPHQTRAQKVILKTTQTAKFDISDDVSGFEYLSFRITKRELSKKMPDLTNMAVVLSDTDGGSAVKLVKDFRTIPDSDFRDFEIVRAAPPVRIVFFNTKSAMLTVLIPLSEFPIELTKADELTIQFNDTLGEVEIDSIHFTN